MAGSNLEAGGGTEREPDGPQDPNRGKQIQGECHDAVTGELYAVGIVLTSAGPDNLATFSDGLSGLLESAGLECRVSLRPLGRGAAWDGVNRV